MTIDIGSIDHKQEKEIKNMNRILELVTKNVNDAHDLRASLEVNYKEVIVVHDGEGYHVCAELDSVKNK